MAQIWKFDFKFECKFSAPLYCIFNILIFLLRGKGLELRSACNYEAKPKQKSSLFLFFGRGGGSTYEASPFLSQALSNPTARERLLHCVQGLFGAVTPKM